MQTALPIYILRESPRARRVHLKVTPADGLIVTVPRNYNLKRLPQVLEDKEAWIDGALRWADEQRALTPARRRLKLPDVVFLQSIGETWDVSYNHTAARKTSTSERPDDLLCVIGAIHDHASCRAALKRWLSRKARLRLGEMLAGLGSETGLSYGRVMVGNQRSRWASCSPGHTISINQKLLFLPERLVRYVLIHELCHTRQLNHSRRFWTAVEDFEPGCKSLDRELKSAGRFVPAWAE
ncbi:MAG: M48 family metallopeptidase [Thermoleophilia bacterium]